jgi:hypothetical protein
MCTRKAVFMSPAQISYLVRILNQRKPIAHCTSQDRTLGKLIVAKLVDENSLPLMKPKVHYCTMLGLLDHL